MRTRATYDPSTQVKIVFVDLQERFDQYLIIGIYFEYTGYWSNEILGWVSDWFNLLWLKQIIVLVIWVIKQHMLLFTLNFIRIIFVMVFIHLLYPFGKCFKLILNRKLNIIFQVIYRHIKHSMELKQEILELNADGMVSIMGRKIFQWWLSHFIKFKFKIFNFS